MADGEEPDTRGLDDEERYRIAENVVFITGAANDAQYQATRLQARPQFEGVVGERLRDELEDAQELIEETLDRLDAALDGEEEP